jgi:hypothetical protein
VIAKKAGKVVSEQTRTVSDDGNSMTSKNTFYPAENGQVEHSEITYVRLGSAPAGANGTSGSWRMDKYKVSDDVHTVSYKSSGDEFSMSDPTGVSYTAKLDGKDYPVKGDYSCNSVSLKRIDERTIEETEKLDGKAVDVTKLTVSADGKTMTQVSTVNLTFAIRGFHNSQVL